MSDGNRKSVMCTENGILCNQVYTVKWDVQHQAI